MPSLVKIIINIVISIYLFNYVLIGNFSSTQAIEAILNEIENQEFTIQDPKDTSFFLTAMNICRFHLQNNELAHRINNLLNFGNNYKFIGNSHNESIY